MGLTLFKAAERTKLAGIETGATAGGGIPSGVIIMWHGLIVNIPSGYVLCNGANSTPDLREKFLRGSPNATEAGGTGGADTHTLAINEIPSHSHWIRSGYDPGSAESSQQASSNQNSVATTATGGSEAHNNMPSYYQILYIMKT